MPPLVSLKQNAQFISDSEEYEEGQQEAELIQHKKLHLEFSDTSEDNSIPHNITKEQIDISQKQQQSSEQDDTNHTAYDPRADQCQSRDQYMARLSRIQYILSNFKDNRNPEIPRPTYIDVLKRDVMHLYGYSEEVADILLYIFGPIEFIQYVQASEISRPTTIRVNSLKIKRRELAQLLISKGVELEPLSWCSEGLTVYRSQVPIGATPEYLRGFYFMQDAASFLSVQALKPQPNEIVLDMASAPGGKTTHIAQMMKNTGTLIANDPNSQRLDALRANLSRCGVTNCIVINYDARKVPDIACDRVLLDAPCTGLGVISKDPRAKVSRDQSDLQRMSQLQRELLWKALDLVGNKANKPRLVCYSTCSVTVAENEEVVDWVIRNRGDCAIVDSGLTIGKPGFTSFRDKHFVKNINMSRRFYPHLHNVHGFFLCLIERKPGAECKRQFSSFSK